MKILGIDEAHRGPLAGPMYVAGVVWDNNYKTFPRDLAKEIKDSKKLSPKKRQELYNKIKDFAKYHIVAIESNILDEKGLSLCIKEAIQEITNNLEYDMAIFDGKWNPCPENKKLQVKLVLIIKLNKLVLHQF